MLLTAEAAETIRHLVETPGAEGLRISHPSESVEGPAIPLQIQLVPAPEPDDAVVELNGARIFLDPTAESTMEDKLLDAAVQGDEIRFVVLEQTEDEQG